MSVQVEVRVVHNRRVETFERTLDNDQKPTVETLIDTFEGQIGTVLSVRTVGGVYLFRAAVNQWEAGAE